MKPGVPWFVKVPSFDRLANAWQSIARYPRPGAWCLAPRSPGRGERDNKTTTRHRPGKVLSSLVPSVVHVAWTLRLVPGAWSRAAWPRLVSGSDRPPGGTTTARVSRLSRESCPAFSRLDRFDSGSCRIRVYRDSPIVQTRKTTTRSPLAKEFWKF